MKLVVYTGAYEVLVCAVEDEHELLRDFFGPENRDLDEYDRETPADYYVEVRAGITA